MVDGHGKHARGAAAIYRTACEQPLDFGPLRRVGRQPLEQLLRLARRVGPASGSREGDREGEARLVEVGVERERALQGGNAVGGLAAVGQHEAEVGADDRVVGFDALARRAACAVAASSRRAAASQAGAAEMGIGARQAARRSRRVKCGIASAQRPDSSST